MTLLNIFRSEPDERVRRLVQDMSRGKSVREVALYRGPVDYAKLVEDIFRSDKVICWW